MVLIRRMLLLCLLMFWLGGFTFYASVVVPVGTEVLQSAREQGRITQPVTNWLNLSGAVALAVWAWDLAAQPAPTRGRQVVRWLVWLALVATLAVLVGLHPALDALFDPDHARVLDRAAFRTRHRWYLWVSTAQWACGIVLSFLTLRGWRDADRRAPDGAREPATLA
jgi:hypothetical protein